MLMWQKNIWYRFEKVSLNTSALNNPNLITEVANIYGSQAVIVSIDVKKVSSAKRKFQNRGLHNTRLSSYLGKRSWSDKIGKSILQSIEGTWSGLDYKP